MPRLTPSGIQQSFAAALAHHRAGRLDEAERLYGRILEADARHADALHFLGILQHARGHGERALGLIRKAIALRPAVAAFHNNLGLVLSAQNRLDEAAGCYAKAVHLEPNYLEAYNNLGNTLRAIGKTTEAIAAYKAAISRDPRYAIAHLNLGRLLLEQGKPAEATPYLQRALTLDPGGKALSSLGSALREQGKPEASLAAYRDALTVSPDDAEARLGEVIAAIPIFAVDARQSRETVPRFMQSLEGLASWSAKHTHELAQSANSYLPFYLAYRPQDVSAALCRYGDMVCSATGKYWHPRAIPEPRMPATAPRTRMLIVSAHVRRHPVWDVILRGLIAQLDRQKFELVLYHLGSACDAQTSWARGQVDRFVQGPKEAQEWIDEVGKLAPDVIFYPEVGMEPVTCLLASLRLAPLQLAAWGHPVTTGLPSIDAFLSGELLEGPDADSHYREKLVRLPGTGVCTEMEDLESEPRPWSGETAASAAIRFALCQQPIKFDPDDDGLFVEIARRVGDCEFWLVRPQKLSWTADRLYERLAQGFRAAGLDPERHLRVTPWLSAAEFAGFLDAMDVSLDAPAFSGYTTAWQAVHRSLPIVTLAGRYLRQRLAAGVLQQIGMADQVARSREDYVELAVRLASERSASPGRAAERRAAIRAAAPRADHNIAAVRAFETVVLQLCAGRKAGQSG